MWVLVLGTFLACAPLYSHTGSLTALLLGMVLPFCVWLFNFSLSVCMQHTHPDVPWFASRAQVDRSYEELSIHVTFPEPLNFITHYPLEHPVHHLNMLVPHYHLKQAEAAMEGLMPGAIAHMPFSPIGVWRMFSRCKLFDYERLVWTDYAGNVTAQTRRA